MAGPNPGIKGLRWLGPLREPVERLISGKPPDDPLYLSNRTIGDRLKLPLAIGIPFLILAGLIIISARRAAKPDPLAAAPPQPTPAEVAAKTLPNIDKVKVESRTDVEVAEVRIESTSPPELVGTVRNKTGRAIATAEIVIDITDPDGSQLGGVSVNVEHLPANGTKDFRMALSQHTAKFAVVREVRSR